MADQYRPECDYPFAITPSSKGQCSKTIAIFIAETLPEQKALLDIAQAIGKPNNTLQQTIHALNGVA